MADFQKVMTNINSGLTAAQSLVSTATNTASAIKQLRSGSTASKSTTTSTPAASTAKTTTAAATPTIIYQQQPAQQAGTNVSISADTKKLLIYGGIGVVGLIAVMMLMRK